jgi:hypothetical protein
MFPHWMGLQMYRLAPGCSFLPASYITLLGFPHLNCSTALSRDPRCSHGDLGGPTMPIPVHDGTHYPNERPPVGSVAHNKGAYGEDATDPRPGLR